MSDDPKVSGSSEYFEEAARSSEFCFEWIELIAQSLVFVVFVSAFIFRIFTVSGNSMRNTLYDRDHVVVRQYGYKPVDGDVIVIAPRNGTLDETIIKRVIATEGESLFIDFETGKVYVNGRLLDESSYIKERMYVSGDNVVPAVVPKGYCFVMGDNRNNSSDSRFVEVGLVKYEKVIGKAEFIYWPPYRWRVIKNARVYSNGDDVSTKSTEASSKNISTSTQNDGTYSQSTKETSVN